MPQHFNRQQQRRQRQTLRGSAPKAERKLWQHLRASQLGVKFRRQYGVDRFVVDFYAPRLKLAIEVDGDSHFLPGAAETDVERTKHLARLGIEVVRFTNTDVFENLEGVLDCIVKVVTRRKSSVTSP